MRGLRLAAIVLFAVLFAAQLTLHNHSLIPEAGGAPPLVCPVCAFGADHVTLATPLFAAVLIFLGLIFIHIPPAVSAAPQYTTLGRAPPFALS